MMMLLSLSGYANAHEWTPTYPELGTSHVPGVFRTEMSLLNRREDVEYFSFQVFDENFEPIPFATPQRTVRLKYLSRKKIDIFIQQKDVNQILYICSKSESVIKKETRTVVSSRICSKVK